MVFEDDTIGKHGPEGTFFNFLIFLKMITEAVMIIVNVINMMTRTPIAIGAVLIGLWEESVLFS